MRALHRRDVVAVLLAAAVAVGTAWAVRDDAPPRERRVAATAEFSPVALRLIGSLTEGRERTYYARYAVRGTRQPERDAPAIEVWRKNGRLRQDLVATEDGVTGRQASYVVDGRVRRCQQRDAGRWTCADEALPATDGPDALVDQVRDTVRHRLVVETRTRVAGRDATCYAVDQDGGTALSICVGADGVPLRIDSDGDVIELVARTDRVDDRDLVPPA